MVWFNTNLSYNSSGSFNATYNDSGRDKNGNYIYNSNELYHVDDPDALPAGYHIPSKEEWVALFTFYGGVFSENGPGDSNTYTGVGKKLKNNGWANDCTGKVKPGDGSTDFNANMYRWRPIDLGSTKCDEDGSLFGVTYLSSTSKVVDGKKYYYTYTISMNHSGYYDDVIERLELVSSDSEYPGDQSKNIAQGKYMIRLVKDE